MVNYRVYRSIAFQEEVAKYDKSFQVRIDKIETNKFLTVSAKDKNVALYDLRNKKIASFANSLVASMLTDIPHSTIFYQLKNNKTKVESTKEGLLFKYE